MEFVEGFHAGTIYGLRWGHATVRWGGSQWGGEFAVGDLGDGLEAEGGVDVVEGGIGGVGVEADGAAFCQHYLQWMVNRS